MNDTGLVLIDKPSGITSFAALNDIKRAVGHGKVGHAGTLDKFARGLLLAGVGRCTRLLSIFEDLSKEYEGTFCFGKTTSTLDPEGEVIEEAGLPSIDEIEAGIPGFIGEIEQVPPAYSALHVDGKRAYQRMRAGEEVVLKPRRVEIYSLDITSWEPPHLTVKVRCSKGTYIRALARDIAVSAGSVAYVSALKRTRIGSFSVEDAVSPSEFHSERHLLKPEHFIEKIPEIAVGHVEADKAEKIGHGTPFHSEWVREKNIGRIMAIFNSHNSLLALVEKREGSWKYRMVFDGGVQ